MIERLRRLAARLRASLWFVPSVIVACAVGTAIGLVELDAMFENRWLARYPRLFGAGAEGSRGMLATIAGSMITVAGVVFSITIVALSLAAAQYSPRVLRNFLEDRTNQVVLGTFVGIFAYCLVVLRTIRGADEGEFVPSIAVLTAVLLAFLGIAVLILFIHHIAHAIQVSQILATTARDTRAAIDRLFPEMLGEAGEAVAPPATSAGPVARRWQPVTAWASGYLQAVDSDALISLAVERDTVVALDVSIGDFVIEGVPVFRVATEEPVDDGFADALRGVLVTGPRRTLDQDAAFGFRQIVDVAERALSPGINDVTTAVSCVDHLGALWLRLADRRFESPYRLADGRLRVVAHGPTFGTLVQPALEEIRFAARDQPTVLDRLVHVIATVGRQTRDRERRAMLRSCAEALRDSARTIPDTRQRARVAAAADAAVLELAQDAPPPAKTAARR